MSRSLPPLSRVTEVRLVRLVKIAKVNNEMNEYPDDLLEEELCQGSNLRCSGGLKHQLLSLHLQLDSVGGQELHGQQVCKAAVTQMCVITVETRSSGCLAVIPDVSN